MKYSKIDVVKEIIWTIITYALYFTYCFVVILLFHLIFYSILKLQWSIPTIALMALAVSTVMIIVRTINKYKKR